MSSGVLRCSTIRFRLGIWLLLNLTTAVKPVVRVWLRGRGPPRASRAHRGSDRGYGGPGLEGDQALPKPMGGDFRCAPTHGRETAGDGRPGSRSSGGVSEVFLIRLTPLTIALGIASRSGSYQVHRLEEGIPEVFWFSEWWLGVAACRC